MPKVGAVVKAKTARVPTVITLKKYGLTEREWKAILKRQGGVCGVCQCLPASGTLHIDHHHVPKWKKMPSEERKKFVRGLVCQMCNRFYITRGITVEKAQGVLNYLKAYEKRRI